MALLFTEHDLHFASHILKNKGNRKGRKGKLKRKVRQEDRNTESGSQ
jgi:hypothetical protein